MRVVGDLVWELEGIAAVLEISIVEACQHGAQRSNMVGRILP